MIAKFHYHSENLVIYDCEIFAIIAKISLFHSEIAQPSCILQPALALFQLDISSSRLDEITENSYELSINQHNCDAKLDTMVEV